MSRRFGKTKYMLMKLREAWERGETTASFSGNYEFIEKQEIDKITQKLITIDWILSPEIDLELERYKEILRSIPSNEFERMVMGDWTQPENEE